MEKVKFPGNGGLLLSGVVHYPAQMAPDGPLLIICHGFRGEKDGGGRAVSLSEKASESGIIALRFDLSGIGESEGDFVDATLTKYIQDLQGALEFAATLTGGPVIVLGRSLGGTAAICVAAGDSRVSAVCTWAAPVDLEDTFIKPVRPLLDSPGRVLTLPGDNGSYELKKDFFEDLYNHNVLKAASEIAPRPMFVLHGTADETVAFAQGPQLYAAAGEPKSKLYVEGADHRFLSHYPMVEQETLGWIRQVAGH